AGIRVHGSGRRRTGGPRHDSEAGQVMMPLLVLSRDRMRRELARASEAEVAMRHYHARLAHLLRICLWEWIAGYAVGMLAFHVGRVPAGQALFPPPPRTILLSPH